MTTFTAEKIANRAFPLLDVTSLNEDDNAQTISALCQKVLNLPLPVAAVCIYPSFLSEAKTILREQIKLATVVNFPTGTLDIDLVQHEIEGALEQGADEIDLVFPYQHFLNGQIKATTRFMESMRKICGSALLKTILETGAYPTSDLLFDAAQLCIDTGTNFLKTSTGKITPGASLDAAAILLSAILKNGGNTGLKISGGIRSINQVAEYFALTDQVMGKNWITPRTFRIGASSLLDELRAVDISLA